MRILDRYIGRQVASGTLFAIAVLTLLLVLGNVFKEIRPLLVEVGAPLWVLVDFVISVLPVSLIFTIPWAFLSAVLLVFGRLSANNELNAFRSAGVGLLRLALPVLVLALLLSGLCLWLNLAVAPQAKRQVEDLVTRTIIRDPRALLRAGADQSRFRNVKVETESGEGDRFHNLHIFVMNQQGGDAGAYVHADTAQTVVDEEQRQIRLRLTNAYSDGSDAAGDDYTMLSRELEWMVVDYSEDARGKPKPNAMSNAEIDAFLARRPNLPERIRARFHAEQTRRYTSSLACLAFALVGVPLGVKARRRDTSTGLVVSLAIGTAYFAASSMIEDSGGGWTMWLPNLACLALGILLFRRARVR